MKKLEKFCLDNNLTLMKVKYRHQFGYCRRVGYDIVKPATQEILCSFEPVEYTSGDRWYLRNVHKGFKGPRYCKRISKKILSYIDPKGISFIRFNK